MNAYLSIPLNELSVSKLNVRSASKLGDIDALAASIKNEGLLHPLLVRQNDIGYEILAGQRRFVALLLLGKEDNSIQAECKVVTVDDRAARAISLSENIHIEGMTAMDQWKAFTDLVKDGWSIDAIAEVYSRTKIDIERTLALGGLPKYVLEAFEAGDLNEDAVKLLAVAPKARVTEWGKLYKEGGQFPSYGHDMKTFIGGGNRLFDTKVALFDVNDSGLAVINDLFSKECLFADAQAFIDKQEKAIAQLVSDLETKGHTVKRLDDDYFRDWDYEKVAVKKGGHTFMRVDGNYSVEVHKGYLTRAEAQRLAQGGKSEEGAPKSKRAELSSKAVEYLSNYMTKAARCQVVEDTNLALCTLLASIICNSESSLDAHGCGAFDRVAQTIGDGEIYETLSQQALKDIRKTSYEPLFDGHSVFALGWGNRPKFDEVLDTLMGMDKGVLNPVMCAIASEIITHNGKAASAVVASQAPDMSFHWSGDQGGAFFGLVRNKTALLGMLEELTDKDVATTHAKDTIKSLQQRVADEAKQNTGWMPAYFTGGFYVNSDGLENIAAFNVEPS